MKHHGSSHSPGLARILGAGLFVASLSTALPAGAQLAVIDPSNLAQSIAQVGHLLDQIDNQLLQIEQQTRMLSRSPLQLSARVEGALARMEALFEHAAGIGFNTTDLPEQTLAAYPATYATVDLRTLEPGARLWREEARRSAGRALRAEADAASALAEARDQIGAAMSASAVAEGQTGAMQAGNQLLGVTAAQLAEIQALLVAQGRAQTVDRLERVAREERAIAIQRRAFPVERPADPAPSRPAF